MSWTKKELISRYITEITTEMTLLDLISFDIRNRATPIITNADLLIMEIEDGDYDEKVAIETLKSMSNHMKDILAVVDAALEIEARRGS